MGLIIEIVESVLVGEAKITCDICTLAMASGGFKGENGPRPAAVILTHRITCLDDYLEWREKRIDYPVVCPACMKRLQQANLLESQGMSSTKPSLWQVMVKETKNEL